MGSFGSGNWADACLRKVSVEICNEISIKLLKENGFLDGSKTGTVEWKNVAGDVVGSVEVESFISVAVAKTSFLVVRQGVLATGGLDQRIELIKWPCNYGGFRYYFACPAVKDGVYCGGRVTKLFLPPGSKVFGCRDCYDLTYQSCQESHKYDRVFWHIDNVDIGSLSVTQALRLGGLDNNHLSSL
jgi:hypothetical protein